MDRRRVFSEPRSAPPRSKRTRLDPSSFHQLLVGPPEARLAAAWRIGLALQPERARALVRRQLAVEPHPGVRRHLVVMLAGLGTAQDLHTVARDDPHEDPRRTARAQLARLTGRAPEPASTPEKMPARERTWWTRQLRPELRYPLLPPQPQSTRSR